MGEGVGATLRRTIACSNCGKPRYVCVGDTDELACAGAMNFERKHGVCLSCEHERYAADPTHRPCPQREARGVPARNFIGAHFEERRAVLARYREN